MSTPPAEPTRDILADDANPTHVADELRRAKARERQRKKRAKDREQAGLPPIEPRSAKGSSSRRTGNEEEDDKKARVREAAKLRQQKHRLAVKLRRQAELDNPMPLPHEMYYGQVYEGQGELARQSTSGGIFASTLMLALSAETELKYSLMRIFALGENELMSIEHALAATFEHWNHSRYAYAIPSQDQPTHSDASPEAGPSQHLAPSDDRFTSSDPPFRRQDPRASFINQDGSSNGRGIISSTSGSGSMSAIRNTVQQPPMWPSAQVSASSQDFPGGPEPRVAAAGTSEDSSEPPPHHRDRGRRHNPRQSSQGSSMVGGDEEQDHREGMVLDGSEHENDQADDATAEQEEQMKSWNLYIEARAQVENRLRERALAIPEAHLQTVS